MGQQAVKSDLQCLNAVRLIRISFKNRISAPWRATQDGELPSTWLTVRCQVCRNQFTSQIKGQPFDVFYGKKQALFVTLNSAK